jgi:hypothetical protein
MSSEPGVDPRGRGLPPTPEEIDAWAEGEHRRRAAWLEGPGEEEKRAWARRYRWRAVLGLEESRLGPTPEEIEQWAGREHKRREAWLAGPSELDKQGWARQQQLRDLAALAGSLAPTAEEIGAWATRERERRRQWLAGPSDAERRAWAQARAGGVFDDLMALPEMLESELPATARQLLREAELAGKGGLYALARAPLLVWSYLVRSGRSFEDELYQRPRRGRVPY